jgi:hypothetical protein
MSTVNNKCSVGNKILLQTENITADNITADNREKALFKIIELIKYKNKNVKDLKKLVSSLKNIKNDCKIIIDNEFADNINLYKIFDYHILNISQYELGIDKTFYDFFNDNGLLSDEYLSDDTNNVIFKLNYSDNDAGSSYIKLTKSFEERQQNIGIYFIDETFDGTIKYDKINTQNFKKIIKLGDRLNEISNIHNFKNISINQLKKANDFNTKNAIKEGIIPLAKKNDTYNKGECLDNIIMFLYDNLKTREKRNEYKKYLIDITTNMENSIEADFSKIETTKLIEKINKEKSEEHNTGGFYQLNIDDLTKASIKDNITFLDFFNKYNLAEEIYDGIIFKIGSRHGNIISSILVILIYRMKKYSIYEIDKNYNFVSCKTNEPFKYSGNTYIDGPNQGYPESVNITSDFNNISINNKYLADTYNSNNII